MTAHSAPDLVSVIIPTHNRSDLIGETLDSVMRQTHPHVEAVVVDDGSTDGTTAVVETYVSKFGPERIRLVRQDKAGAQKARNAGIMAARGEYLNFLDDDDLLSTTKIASQVEVAKRSGAELVYGPSVDFSMTNDRCLLQLPQNVNPYRPRGWGLFEGWLLGWRWYLMSAILRKDFVERIGPWDETLERYQDLEYIARALRLNPRIEHCPSGAMFRRLHPRCQSNRDLSVGLESFYRFSALVESYSAELPAVDRRGEALAVFMADWATHFYTHRQKDLAAYAEKKSRQHAPDYIPEWRTQSYRVCYAIGGFRLLGLAKRIKIMLMSALPAIIAQRGAGDFMGLPLGRTFRIEGSKFPP